MQSRYSIAIKARSKGVMSSEAASGVLTVLLSLAAVKVWLVFHNPEMCGTHLCVMIEMEMFTYGIATAKHSSRFSLATGMVA